MSQRQKPGSGAYAAFAVPVVMLGVFFLGPFLVMVATSFYRREPGGFYEEAFVFNNYRLLLDDIFIERVVFSIGVCLLAAAVCLGVGFPFTYMVTRMPRRPHVALLVVVLSALSLSEVIVGFSWSVLLGRASGVGNILVWLGVMDEATAYAPGFWAVLLGLSYIAFPYCILTLYPPLSRLDREVTEAAQTLGASPWRTFWTVVVPVSRTIIVAAFLLVLVFTLGSYLIPAILGRPEHWTVSVFISDQASFNANVPSRAMALVLTALSLAIVTIAILLESRARRAF